MKIAKLFKRHRRELRDAFKEIIHCVSDGGEGPFNTDPLIEPRLTFFSRKPDDAWIASREKTPDGICNLFVIFVCKATIRCGKYKDNGKDKPHSLGRFAGGITCELPVSFEIDPESGESDVIDINSIAWEKWRHWPS